jgi:hypothetical protein
VGRNSLALANVQTEPPVAAWDESLPDSHCYEHINAYEVWPDQAGRQECVVNGRSAA